jgi:murein DD-endopeptidase MepM/ murein hydrolase activator NlpD
MSKHKHKARGKVTQKLTRDGLVERNAVTGEQERISKRSSDFDIRGDKSADRALSQVGTKPDGKQSARQRNRAVYKNAEQQRQLQDGQSADTAEVKQDAPHKSVAVENVNTDNSAVADNDRADYGEHSPLRQEQNTPLRPPSVRSKSPPGKEQRYYQQFAEPQSDGQSPVSAAKPQPRKSVTDFTDAPAEPTPSKLQTERESKFQTDGDSALRFSRDEVPPQGKTKHQKQRYNRIEQPVENAVRPSMNAVQPPMPIVVADKTENTEPQSELRFDKPDKLHFAEDAAKEPIIQQKPKQRQPAPPSDITAPTARDAGATPIESADVPTPVPYTPLKEPEAPLKPQKQSKLQFTEDETTPKSPSRVEIKQQKRYGKAQTKADKSVKKSETAKSKLPAKKKLRSERVFNEETGKTKRKLHFESEVKSQGEHLKGAKPLRPVKAASNSALAFGHRKMYQVERENVATEAAHKGEISAEGGVRMALRHHKLAPYRKVAKLERTAQKKSVNLAYQKALAENPKLKSSVLSRFAQKQKIKRDYAKAAREAKKTAERAKKVGSAVEKTGKAVIGVVKRHPVATGVIVLLLLLLFCLMSLIGVFGGAGSGGLGGILSASYLAEDADIDNAELLYTEWETDLQIRIANTEASHSGYDEYRYNVGDISHNPYELMAYLTAKYQNFNNSTAQAELASLFGEQFTLAFAPSVEIRYADPSDADDDGDYEPYNWNVLTVTLTAKSFTDVVSGRMTSDELGRYAILMQTKGSRQYLANPFGDMNWLPYVTSYYGYRIHPISGEKNYHKGVDIGLPTGTPIQSGQDGTVTFAGYSGDYGNVVIIEDDKGLVSKYAHCDTLNVAVGQTVKTGDVIATVGNTGGSTGSHLHLEILKNGQYLNALYFADSGSFSLTPTYGYAGAAMEPGTYAAMIAEAEKYLSYPYVWGGSSPSTSFDCSGYVSWVINHSGWNVGRLGATGLYNVCTPVSPADAKPGDLVFFEGTYSAPNPVTHVGIYVGTDASGRPRMLHCGSPIQYTYIDTTYWQQHFFAFGRLP